MSGLTSTGFEGKTLEEILEDQRSRAVAEFGPNIKTTSDEVLGHLIAIQAEGLHQVWELEQVIYDAFNPNNAQGEMLDNIVRLLGLSREPATKAAGVATATGTDGVVITAGSIVAAPTLNDAHFVVLSDATIGSTVSGQVDLDIEAEVAGALSVSAGEVDTIITPISGWSAVSNALALASGKAVESDSDLRRRREVSLSVSSAGTDASIRARVMALDDVSTAIVLSNRTLTTDSNGIPPKAFLTVIWPATGVDEERVAQTIFETMPSGIESDGVKRFDVTDEQGITHSSIVGFSYATEVKTAIKVTVTPMTGWPVDGIEQVENAVRKLFDGAASTDSDKLLDVVGSGLTVGDDLRVIQLNAAIFTVPGIQSIVLLLDKSAVHNPPVGTSDVVISPLEIATLDDADLTVTL